MKTTLGLVRTVQRIWIGSLALCAFAASAAAQTLDVVHRFESSGGAYGRLIQASDGDLYGTTSSGGQNGVGTVFKVDASGTLTTIHSFGYADGTSPKAALLQAADGDFYGTTSAGGTGNEGTVFKMDAAGNVTTLHNFGLQDGAKPSAPLIQATDGNFYGTTVSGGTGGCSPISTCGTVFRMDSSGNVTTLHSFANTDGSHPVAALLEAADGNFYGTTSSGGAGGYGTVFKMDAAGNVTTIHVFVNSSGGNPELCSRSGRRRQPVRDDAGSPQLLLAVDRFGDYGRTEAGRAHPFRDRFQDRPFRTRSVCSTPLPPARDRAHRAAWSWPPTPTCTGPRQASVATSSR